MYTDVRDSLICIWPVAGHVSINRNSRFNPGRPDRIVTYHTHDHVDLNHVMDNAFAHNCLYSQPAACIGFGTVALEVPFNSCFLGLTIYGCATQMDNHSGIRDCVTVLHCGLACTESSAMPSGCSTSDSGSTTRDHEMTCHRISVTCCHWSCLAST